MQQICTSVYPIFPTKWKIFSSKSCITKPQKKKKEMPTLSRRKVLHPEYKYKKLTTVTEEELKCSKTKEEEAEKIRQLIREN